MFYPEGIANSWFSNIVNAIWPGRRLHRFYSSQYMIGTKAAIWIDRLNLWLVYSEIPHINNVINKRAELLSIGKLRLRKKAVNGEAEVEIFKHDALTLLRRPNPLQAYSEFITQYLVYKDIYGNAIFYKNKKIFGKIPATLWNLPPWTIKINPTGKIFDQITIEGIIQSYTMTLAGVIRDFTPDEIIVKNDNVDSEYLKSQSKFVALVKPISNIAGAMQTANIMIHDGGSKGILSNASKDGAGGIPIGETERKRIEEDYLNRYGIRDGQSRTIITNAGLVYQPMSFPMKDMMLTEEIEQDFGIICDAYSVDRDVFASTKGATNENKLIGIKSTIQNSIQPEADDFCETFNEVFGLNDLGLELYITFDHLPVMQEDALNTSKGYLAKVQALDIMKKSGIISPKQYATEAEVKFDGTGISETPTQIDPNKKPNENENEGQV